MLNFHNKIPALSSKCTTPAFTKKEFGLQVRCHYVVGRVAIGLSEAVEAECISVNLFPVRIVSLFWEI